MQFPYDPFIANMTPSEFERMVYVEPWATAPRAQLYLEALRSADHAEGVRDVLENVDLDFDDVGELGKSIEKLMSVDDRNSQLEVRLETLLDAIDTVVELLKKPAHHGSVYAKQALTELEFATRNEER